MRRWLAALGVLGLAIACKRLSHAPGSAPSGSAAPHGTGSADRQHVGAGAFDLVSTDDGAALVWAHNGSVSLTVLDQLGAERRTEPAFDASVDAGVSSSSISEIAAVAHGSELGIAWLEQAGSTAQTRGLVRKLIENGSAASAIIEIGPVLTPVSSPRGNLAIASSKDHFLVMSRGQKSDCIDATQNDCVGFGFHRLDGARAIAQNLPLTVPLPCDQNSVSFAVAGSRFYYGVCSRATGKPVTTLFSIQSDPEYARADRILEGCLPVGALSQGGDLLVIGDCGGERRGVRVRGGNAETSDLRVDRVDAVCDAGHPLIHQLGPGGLSLTLDAPRDRLEAFLPPEYAAPAARAVWTGQTLLVASLKNDSITLKGYRCDSTLLREVPLGAATR